MLLGVATNIRQLKGKEITAQQAAEAAKRRGMEVKYSKVYLKDGKPVMDKLVGGIPVGTVQAPDTKQFRYFQSPEGKIEPFPLGVAPPPGYTAVTQVTKELTPGQRVGIEKELAKYRSWLTSSDADPELLEGYAELFNKYHPTEQAVLIPAKPPKVVMGVPVPGTGEPARWEIVPKVSAIESPQPPVKYTKENPATPTTEEEYNALPSGAVFRDPDDGQLYIKE